MMKIWMIAVFTTFYVMSEWVIILPVSLLWLKYIALAMALFMLSAIITQRSFHRLIQGKTGVWIRRTAVLILLLYAWLCLDTFLLDMKLPMSGMIRYALFDFTLPLSALFITAGILYGVSTPTSNDIRK